MTIKKRVLDDILANVLVKKLTQQDIGELSIDLTLKEVLVKFEEFEKKVLSHYAKFSFMDSEDFLEYLQKLKEELK